MTALLARIRGIIQKVAAATGLSNYAVLDTYEPETVADFENEYYRSGGSDTTFTGLFSFSRASTATYFDSSGNLQTASSGVARVGHHVYNGTSWVNQGILVEPSRSNRMYSSTDLSDFGTIEATLSLTSSPFSGTGNAVLVTENTAADRHLTIASRIPISSSDVLTASVFLKDNGRQYVSVVCSRSDGTRFMVDLVNKTITDTLIDNIGQNTQFLDGPYLEEYPDNWVKVWHTVTGVGTGIDCHFMVALSDRSTYTGSLTYNNPRYTGDGTSGVYVYAPQWEIGYGPTSYIPTTSKTAVTRAADSLSIAGTDLAYDATNMSFAMDGVITYADEGTAAQHTFFEWASDANNYISMDLDTDGADTGEVNGNQSATGTLTTVAATSSYSAGAYVPYSIAMRNTSSAINIAKDGTSETEDTSPTELPDLSATSLVFAEDDAVMTVKTFRQWGDDITDAGIEAAS